MPGWIWTWLSPLQGALIKCPPKRATMHVTAIHTCACAYTMTRPGCQRYWSHDPQTSLAPVEVGEWGGEPYSHCTVTRVKW